MFGGSQACRSENFFGVGGMYFFVSSDFSVKEMFRVARVNLKTRDEPLGYGNNPALQLRESPAKVRPSRMRTFFGTLASETKTKWSVLSSPVHENSQRFSGLSPAHGR